MLDTANGGREPQPHILRAIRHGIAAGACRRAARADPAQAERWSGLAGAQSRLAAAQLNHAGALSSVARRASADGVGL